MDELFASLLLMVLVIAVFPLLLWRRRQESRSPQPPVVPHQDTVVHHGGVRRMRRRPAASASTSSAMQEDIAVQSEEEDSAGDNYVAKSSKKKEKKRQKREAQRQAEEAARETRQTKQDRYAEMRRRRDEEREAQERLLEEEAMARKAKEEEAATLEFEKWKGEFSVDAEGSGENEMPDGSQGLLFDFVEYIKEISSSKGVGYSSTSSSDSFSNLQKQKCVPLEDLAAEFKLRTQDCINRINSLEKMGRLSGVMDDRGKYIYISLEEMQAVADYIKRQGRVSISHLASRSNQFIDLEPKVQLDSELGAADAVLVA